MISYSNIISDLGAGHKLSCGGGWVIYKKER